MEAKLATMAKTKPADEDYVPGSSRYPLGATAGSASPLSGAEMHDEEMLGEEAGALAADDLQKELDAEMNAAANSGGEAMAADGAEAVREPIKSPNIQPVDLTNPTLPSLAPPSIAGLPARPAAAPTFVPAATTNPTQSRSAEIKRGLAGLPKKPVF